MESFGELSLVIRHYMDAGGMDGWNEWGDGITILSE